jgi:hypothetical protein
MKKTRWFCFLTRKNVESDNFVMRTQVFFNEAENIAKNVVECKKKVFFYSWQKIAFKIYLSNQIRNDVEHLVDCNAACG